MENEFADVMAKRRDSELLQIVTKQRDDYQPEALRAAENELQKRNLSSEEIKQANDEIQIKELSHKEKENEPLESWQKILFFVFFWGVVPWAMAGTFKSNGYLRKNKDGWRFMKFGLLTFIVFNALILLTIYLILK